MNHGCLVRDALSREFLPTKIQPIPPPSDRLNSSVCQTTEHKPGIISFHPPTATPLLLFVLLLHHENLDEADEDVEEIELERDALVDRISLDNTALGKTGVVQHLLDIIQGKATKEGQTTVQPDVLGEGQGTDGSGGKDQGSEARDGDNGSTGKERTADVEVLLLLSGGADERDTAHHGDGVETGTGEERGRGDGHEGGDESGLGSVEDSPEGVLGDVAVNQKSVSEGHEREG